MSGDSASVCRRRADTNVETNSAHARQLGIDMVSQHFPLFETLTVLENIAISMERSSSADMDALANRITELSAK